MSLEWLRDPMARREDLSLGQGLSAHPRATVQVKARVSHVPHRTQETWAHSLDPCEQPVCSVPTRPSSCPASFCVFLGPSQEDKGSVPRPTQHRWGRPLSRDPCREPSTRRGGVSGQRPP